MNYLQKKLSIEAPVTTLVAGSTVSVNMGVAAMYSLTLNQNTTITLAVTNTFNKDVTTLRVTGDFLLSFVDAGKTFVGDVDGSGVCLTYNGIRGNTVQIICLNKTTELYGVYCLTDKA